MVGDQGAFEGHVTIRVPRHALGFLWVQGGFFIAAGGYLVTTDHSAVWRVWQLIGIVTIAQAICSLFFHVELTAESVKLGGVLRRSVPWSDVQDVSRYDGFGSTAVRLVRKSGRPVKLRAPSMMWGMGRDQYERDFHLIQQWSLAHSAGQGDSVVDPAEGRLD